jgi:hypothetical protein
MDRPGRLNGLLKTLEVAPREPERETVEFKRAWVVGEGLSRVRRRLCLRYRYPIFGFMGEFRGLASYPGQCQGPKRKQGPTQGPQADPRLRLRLSSCHFL